MPTYSELLEMPEWKVKRKEIVTRDKQTCQICSNYNHLMGLKVGYINRSEINNNELCLGWNFSGLQNSSVVHFDGMTYMLYIKDRNTLGFNDLYNYLVYFEIIETHRYIVAISEVDIPFTSLNSYRFIGSKNPFKQKDFITKAKYLVVHGLHVHHTYYQLDKMPWEYPSKSLMTVCWKCHEELHKSEKVPILDSNNIQIGELTPCDKCCGAGYIPQYRHVENGICWDCNGKRFIEFKNHSH